MNMYMKFAARYPRHIPVSMDFGNDFEDDFVDDFETDLAGADEDTGPELLLAMDRLHRLAAATTTISVTLR